MIARRGVIKYLKYYRHAGDKRPDIIITRYTEESNCRGMSGMTCFLTIAKDC